MFEDLFTRPAAIEEYRNAPLAEDRLRYLVHCAERGAARRDFVQDCRRPAVPRPGFWICMPTTGSADPRSKPHPGRHHVRIPPVSPTCIAPHKKTLHRNTTRVAVLSRPAGGNKEGAPSPC